MFNSWMELHYAYKQTLLIYINKINLSIAEYNFTL